MSSSGTFSLGVKAAAAASAAVAGPAAFHRTPEMLALAAEAEFAAAQHEYLSRPAMGAGSAGGGFLYAGGGFIERADYCPPSGLCADFEVLFGQSGADAAYEHACSGASPWYKPVIFQNEYVWCAIAFFLALGLAARLLARPALDAHYRRKKCREAAKAKKCAAERVAQQQHHHRGGRRPSPPQPHKIGAYATAPIAAGAAEDVWEMPSEQEIAGESVVLRRYIPSFVHACIATVLCGAAVLGGNGFYFGFSMFGGSSAGAATSSFSVDVGLSAQFASTYYGAALASIGYFIADMIVDRDPVYWPHHLTPIVYVEFALRHNISLYHPVVLGLFCEFGNAVCHFVALYLRSIKHPTYVRCFKLVNGVMRLAALAAGALMVYCDVPLAAYWDLAPYVALSVLALFGSNVFAVVAVLRDPETRSTTVGASVGSSCCSLTSIFSFGGGVTEQLPAAAHTKAHSKFDAKRCETSAEPLVVQRHPAASPYKPTSAAAVVVAAPAVAVAPTERPILVEVTRHMPGFGGAGVAQRPTGLPQGNGLRWIARR